MTRVIDMEIGLPHSEANPDLERIARGRPGTPFPQPLDRPEGYGFANYGRVFKARNSSETSAEVHEDGGLERLIEDMDRANIQCGLLVGAENTATARIHARYPGRFFTFVTLVLLAVTSFRTDFSGCTGTSSTSFAILLSWLFSNLIAIINSDRKS